MADNSGPFRLFWPEIDDSQSAKAASRLGIVGIAILVGFAVVNLVYGSLRSEASADPVPWSWYTEMLLFVFFAFGIWKLWRWAAVAALVLFLLEQVAVLLYYQRVVGVLMPIVIALLLISGVRGTFAYAKYVREEARANSQETGYSGS